MAVTDDPGAGRREAQPEGDEILRLEQAAARFVPPRLLDLLGATDLRDLRLGDSTERKMTVLFADICGFTPLCEAMSPADTFRFLNGFLAAVEPAVEAHGGFVDKYIGDAVMALFPASADDAVAAGVGMIAAIDPFNEARAREGLAPIRIGVGLNTGVVMLGIVGGGARLEGTVVSDAVNLASRIEGLTRLYGAPLLIGERTLYALARPDRASTRYLDRIRVKGKRQPQSIHEVLDADPPALRAAKASTLATFEQAVAWYHLRRIDRAEPLLRACVEAAPDDAPARLYLDRCRAFREEGLHAGTGELEGALAWRAEFETGVATIDAQHRQLVRHMNDLTGALRAGDDRVGELVDFLGEYAREHFGMEERLMEQHGYPLAAAHRVEHRNFIAFHERLRAEILSGAHAHVVLAFRAEVFLLDWFATHTTGTDRPMTRWLRTHGLA